MILWLTGCVYRVALTSVPMPAQVTLPSGEMVVTPVEVDLRWAPLRPQVLTVSAPGHRSVTVDLHRDEVRFGRLVATTLFRSSTWSGAPRGEVRVVLVPEHGPAGTAAPP
jgi:hypothetical protein